MKKKFLVITIIAAIAFTSVALASGFVVEQIPISNIEPKLTDLSIETITEVVKSNLDSGDQLRKADEFASIMTCNNEAKFYNICAYVEFIGQNSFSPQQLKIINDILGKGTTIQSLAQVYDFWLSTNEPFEIIEEICNLENTYFSEFWYENAFNKLTNNKHGVLDSKDIDAYLDKGITADQILTANTLCRKGVYTINQILDKVVKGENIETIACEIYEIDTLPQGNTSLEKVNLALKTKKYNITTSLLGDNANSMTTAIETVENTFYNAIDEKIESEIKRLGIKDISDNTANENNSIINSDLPISTIKALLNKGFTNQEISKIENPHNDDIFESAKIARKELINE